jgi:fructokinase
MIDQPIIGGIELGGTKTVVAVGYPDGTLIDSRSLPTGDPRLLVDQISAYFKQQASVIGPISAVGAGAFGPIVLDCNAEDYGCLLETNKAGWSGFPLHKSLTAALDLPVALVTDVGAAGIGEAHLGALRTTEIGLYLTVGTGIGGAIICRGLPLPAMLHPELGHLPLHRQAQDRAASLCKFHSDCAEGLAAGPAIEARFGSALSHFEQDSGQVALVADYLGQLCATLTLILSPQKIVIGGGVMKTAGLFAHTHAAMQRHLNGYAAKGTQQSDFICPPLLGDHAGITGAILAATQSS